MNQLSITYKVCLEAEDISVSRIQSSTAFVKSLLEKSANPYLRNAGSQDESDLDAYILRFYIEGEIQEAECASREDAQSFAFDLAQLLETVSAAHSYMDIEGKLSFAYDGERKDYTFRSESGQDYCDIL